MAPTDLVSAADFLEPSDWESESFRQKDPGRVDRGGGIEHRVSANWSVKGEALYYDLGKVSVTNDMLAVLDSGAGFFFDVAVSKTNEYKFNGIVARAGANYKF